MATRRMLPIVLVAALLLASLTSALLTGSGAASAAGPTLGLASFIGPELLVSEPTSPESVHTTPAVTYNPEGQEYLALWVNQWNSGTWDIYARRITSTGVPLGAFVVSSGSGQRYMPAAAFDGASHEYLIVWMYRATSSAKWDIYGRRFTADGTPLGSAEFLIFTWANRSFTSPRVVWNSVHNCYMVLSSVFATDTSKWNDVAARLVLANGSMPNAGGSVSEQDQLKQPQEGAIAYNPGTDEYLVVWCQEYSPTDKDIWAARLRGSDGTLVSPPGRYSLVTTNEDQSYPAIAAAGNDYVLAFQQTPIGSTTNRDIYAVGLDHTGSPVSTPVLIAGSTDPEKFPAVAAITRNPIQFCLVWQRSTATGLEAWGWVLDEHAVPTVYQVSPAGGQDPPVIASSASGYLVIYSKSWNGTEHLFGRVLGLWGAYIPLVARNSH